MLRDQLAAEKKIAAAEKAKVCAAEAEQAKTAAAKAEKRMRDVESEHSPPYRVEAITHSRNPVKDGDQDLLLGRRRQSSSHTQGECRT